MMIKPYYENRQVKLYHGDCLDIMPQLTERFDACITDPPYGTTVCKWDTVIPFEPMWKNLKNLVKDNGVICLFCQGMFTSELMQSNKFAWRYNLIWDKQCTTGFLNANRMPLRGHEDICVFYYSLPVYHPQMTKCDFYERNHGRGNLSKQFVNNCYGNFVDLQTKLSDEKFPKSIISIPREHIIGKFFHPTQKPVSLIEYLIKTYTDENDIVLDFCAGSGTTGVACMNTNRRCVLIEKEQKYCDIIVDRLESNKDLFNMIEE